jgi:hypothetical protein
MADTAIDELLHLKDQALEATKRGDGEFYTGYLSDDAVALTPMGKLPKPAIVKAMSGASPFRSLGVDDVEARLLSPDMGLVTYTARYAKPDGGETSMLTSTLYRRTGKAWKGVFYQQTPLAPKA